MRAGNPTAVRALLKQHVDVNAREVDGTTALHLGRAIGGRADRLPCWSDAGADLNAVNRYGCTPLSLAARTGNARVLDVLLKAGASVKAADASLAEGQTLLMLAARTGSVDAVKLLVDARRT